MDDAGKQELRLRLLSVVALAPIFLAVVYLGSPYLEIMFILAGLAMAWEWDRMCGGRRFGASGAVSALAILLAGIAAWDRRYDLAVMALVAGAAAAFGVAAATRRGHEAWIALAPLVVGIPCVAVIWLRADPVFGLRNLIWLIGVVWATDTFGFIVGRRVGGRKLAPTVSPGKTWSGLAGAVIGAAGWGLVWGYWAGAADLFWLSTILAAGAAVVAQCGDLGVSLVKRRFGVKDASNLIPGHGGVLDRFDGLLSTAPSLVLLMVATRGSGMLWQ